MTKKQRKIWELEQYILKRQEAVSNFCDACATVLVSVVFWPSCLSAGEESSSTCGGAIATEVLGWMKVSSL
jgi:hypothetical protein